MTLRRWTSLLNPSARGACAPGNRRRFPVHRLSSPKRPDGDATPVSVVRSHGETTVKTKNETETLVTDDYLLAVAGGGGF